MIGLGCIIVPKDKGKLDGRTLADIAHEDLEWAGDIYIPSGRETYDCPKCGGEYVIMFNDWCVCQNCDYKDKRRTFLVRLQELLRKFDAEIGDRGPARKEGAEIIFGDDTPPIRYKHYTLNADNIMDFDKE